MENESKPSGESAPARFHFHLALVNVFFPVMWLPAVALAVFFREGDSESLLQRRWKRYLWALLVVDLLVFACYGWMIAHPERLERSPRESERPRIGVVWEPDPAGSQTRIQTVLPGSPAERAGLRPGDVIEKIDGAAASDRKKATEMIRSGEPGVVRTLTVRRDGSSTELPVAPELPKREERGLFQPRPAEKSADWVGGVAAFLPSMAVVAIAALASRRKRRVLVVTWRGFLAASIGSFAVAIGTAMIFRALQGGSSTGAVLVMLFAQMMALAGLTRVATVWCGREVPPPADPIAPLPPVRATLLGIYYLITGVARVSILVWTVDQIFFQGRTAARTQGLEVLATSPLGAWGTILFVFVVVVLGPFAEESLFRGFLVPRLAAMWGSFASILVSALLFALFHPHYGLFMPIVFLYGWVFAWARLRTGGIGVPFLLHLSVNGLVSAVMLLK
jgi:membrane protease YdiL (CAAX protease family)